MCCELNSICEKDKMRVLWDGRIRTSEQRDQNPLPYHLATPHFDFKSRIIFLLIVRQFQPKLGQNPVNCYQDFNTCIYRMKLNFLIITYNSIKIMYESMISSILFLFENGRVFDYVSSKKRKYFQSTLLSSFFAYLISITQSKCNNLQEKRCLLCLISLV